MGARYVMAVRCFWIMFWVTLVFFCATMDGCRAHEASAESSTSVAAAATVPERNLSLSIDDVVKWLFLTLTGLAVYIVKGMQTTQRELLVQVQSHDTRIAIIERVYTPHKEHTHE